MRIQRDRGVADQPQGPPQPATLTRDWRVGVMAAVAFGGTTWLVAGAPMWRAGWLLMLGVALLVGLIALMVAPGTVRWVTGRQPQQPAAAVAVLAAAVLAGLPGGWAAGWATGASDPQPPRLIQAVPCDPGDPPVELRVLAAPRQLAATQQLAVEYEHWTARTQDGCPAVRTHVYPAPAEAAVDALGTGWAELPALGPRPDVWVPGSLSEVDDVRAAIDTVDTRLSGLSEQVVGWSPVVLAVAESSATQAPASQREGSSWAELVEVAGDVGWELARPDPAASVVGELVNATLYGSGTELERTSLARDLEVRVSRALDQGGYQFGDTQALLCHHRQRGTAGSETAVLVTEQAVARYNRGDALGHGCAPLAGTEDPSATALPATAAPGLARSGCVAADPLVAFYPADTVAAAYPVVRLSWQPRDTPQAWAAERFQEWLSTAVGQQSLAAAGLRPAGAPPASEASPAAGADQVSGPCGTLPTALPEVGYPALQPTSEMREQARAAYATVQQPGRVLIAMDVSGSMNAEVGDGLSRHDVAVSAVEGALRRLGERDEFGLWVFPAPAEGRELVPLGPAGAQHDGQARDEAAVNALRSLSPGGSTPLHRTIVDGVAEVGEFESGVAALVVVTDGEDTERDPGVDGALAELDSGAGVRIYVVAVGEASCGIDEIAGVVQRTNGRCLAADFALLDAQLGELFGVLWSGD